MGQKSCSFSLKNILADKFLTVNNVSVLTLRKLEFQKSKIIREIILNEVCSISLKFFVIKEMGK